MEHIGHGVLLPANEGSSCGELLAEAQRVWPFFACSPRTRQRLDDAARRSPGLRELACCYQPPCLEIAPAQLAQNSAFRVPDAVCPEPPGERPMAAEQAAPGADSVQVNLSAQRESFVMQTMRQAHYSSVESLARADGPHLPAIPPARESTRSLHASRPRTTGPRLSAAAPAQEAARPPEEPPGRVQFRGAPEGLQARPGGPAPEQETPAPGGGLDGPSGDPQRFSEFSDFGNELLAAMRQGPEDSAESRQVCGASWVDVQGLLEDDSEHSEFYRFIEKELARLPQQHTEPALPDSSVSFGSLPIHVSPRPQQIIEPTPAAVQEAGEPASPLGLPPDGSESPSSRPATPGLSDSISADITESLLVEGRPLPDHPVQEDPQAREPTGGDAGYSDEAFDSSASEAADALAGGGSALLGETGALLAEPGAPPAESAGPAPEEEAPGLPQELDDELAGLVGPDEQDLLGSIGGELRELLMDSGDESVLIPSEL